MADRIGLSAPWITYFRKIEALFDRDPEVMVDFDDENTALKIYVDNQGKAEAIDALLPDAIQFGNVEMGIQVIPANGTDPRLELFRKAFEGNEAVVDITTVDSSVPILGGNSYVLFKPEVVQYYNDDLSTLDGYESTLYEDIADELLSVGDSRIHFCTARLVKE